MIGVLPILYDRGDGCTFSGQNPQFIFLGVFRELKIKVIFLKHGVFRGAKKTEQVFFLWFPGDFTDIIQNTNFLCYEAFLGLKIFTTR